MQALLPPFRYHPDPLATGSFEARGGVCKSCGLQRNIMYVGPVYSRFPDIRGNVCPWCIADGSAHEKFACTFVDDFPLKDLPQAIILEVTTRTPGFASWQQDEWLSHCGDACAFLGDASRETLAKFKAGERRAVFNESTDIDDDDWSKFVSNYAPGGDPSVYHFRCLSCSTDLFGHDCS